MDEGEDIPALFYLEHVVADGRILKNGQQQVVSQKLQFVEINAEGIPQNAGPAPYLDYRPLTETEQATIWPEIDNPEWLRQDFEKPVIAYTIQYLVPQHIQDVKTQRLALINKVEREVAIRLRRAMTYWDSKAESLKHQEKAGKRNAKLNLAKAMAKTEAEAEELSDRLQRRLQQLAQEREFATLPPVVKGGALVIPKGHLCRLMGVELDESSVPIGRTEVEQMAMAAVMAAEQRLGWVPRDVSAIRGLGYDVESKDPESGSLIFIEVKGRWHLKHQVTVTRNEILCSRNEPDKFCLALVEIDKNGARPPVYLKRCQLGDPSFTLNSGNCDIRRSIESAQEVMHP